MSTTVMVTVGWNSDTAADNAAEAAELWETYYEHGLARSFRNGSPCGRITMADDAAAEFLDALDACAERAAAAVTHVLDDYAGYMAAWSADMWEDGEHCTLFDVAEAAATIAGLHTLPAARDTAEHLADIATEARENATYTEHTTAAAFAD